MRLWWFISLVCLLWALSAQAQLSNLAAQWKNDKDLTGASYAFCVAEIGSGKIVAELEPQRLLIPASTLKIITTAAALGILGPSYRYETRLHYAGSFDKATGTLSGDLVIAGSGDPSLQSEYFGKESVTDTWAKALKQAGLKKITGNIIADASFFDREIPGDWIWADIGNYFGAVPCGISFMDNKFKVVFNSGASGTQATLQKTFPNYNTEKFLINSSVTAFGSEDEAYVYGDPFSFKKEIRGSIPPNKTAYEIEAALPDPALLCAEMLQTSLEKNGVTCNGQARSNYNKKQLGFDKKAVYIHFSPPLEKLVYHTNQKSNNLYCQSLLLTLGNGKAAEGILAIKNFCKERGLNTDELLMSDGCGLSRANLVSTSLLTRLLLKQAKDSVRYAQLKSSFPAAGKSGSMANIGRGTFIENNMHAKTGYIQRARAYSGYVTSRSGKQLAFSVILNNYTCSAREAKLKLEKFLVELGEL